MVLQSKLALAVLPILFASALSLHGSPPGNVSVSSSDSSVASTRAVTRTSRSLRRRHKEWVPPTAEEESVVDAHNAAQAADAAHSAADVATHVATHSIHVTEHAESALKNAHEVLHNARVDTESLPKDQRDILKTAETKLRRAAATKTAEYGKVEQARYNMRKLHDKLGARETHTVEAYSMRDEVRSLREELRHSRGGRQGRQADASAEALDQKMAELEASMQGMNSSATGGDEFKAEIERLRETVHRYEEVPAPEAVSSEHWVEVKSAAPEPPPGPDPRY